MVGPPTPGRPEVPAMTDPTTRYPLPDEPGTDPLAVDAPPVDAAPVEAAATPVEDAAPTMTTPAADAPPPPPPPPPTAIGSASPPPPPPAAWTPPSHDEGRWPARIFGLILLAVGLWFFIEVTLGIDLPTIRWGQLWPLILIVIGVLILYGARLGRKR
jgi:hypothetical protein